MKLVADVISGAETCSICCGADVMMASGGAQGEKYSDSSDGVGVHATII